MRAGGFLRQLMQMQLHGKWFGARGRRDGHGGTIRPDDIGLRIITEAGIQNTEHALRKFTVFDGHHQLHAAVQVAAHPVRAGHVHQGAARIAEAEDACMLQIAVHNADNTRAHLPCRRVRRPAANTADVEADAHPGLRGLFERLHDFPVIQGVHLRANFRHLAPLGAGGFHADELQQALLHQRRAGEEAAVAHEAGQPGHGIEKL